MSSKEKIQDAIYERNYVYNFHFHLIWCTKYRKPVFINSQLVEEMKSLLQKIADLNEITVE